MTNSSQEAAARRAVEHFASQTNAGGKPNPAREREIPALTERLEKSISMLEETVSSIFERLSSVLQPEAPEESERKEPKQEPASPYGQTLFALNVRLKRKVYHLQDVIKRLEI